LAQPARQSGLTNISFDSFATRGAIQMCFD